MGAAVRPLVKDTLQSRMAAGAMSGFDWLRIVLASAVMLWHAISLAAGDAAIEADLWGRWWRFLPVAILPMFFALSGFLVSGSLERETLQRFVMLRVLRLVPALAVEVALVAVGIGLLFTTLPARLYLNDPMFHAYFLNAIGWVHFSLPGVFTDNPGGSQVNAQLWTVPYELECYVVLVVMAATGAVRRHRWLFAAAIVAATAALQVSAVVEHPGVAVGHVFGRELVVAFLAGTLLFRFRDLVPYSPTLGIGCVLACCALFSDTRLAYFGAFPLAYATAWLGMMRPPRMVLGDLSYGVFLFHYPVEQSIVHMLPWVRSWTALSAVAAPVVFCCAWLSWTLVERPILRRKAAIIDATLRGVGAASALLRRTFRELNSSFDRQLRMKREFSIPSKG
jgi:peptidoglycan/LPS O-acetylase OafA/YrhL